MATTSGAPRASDVGEHAGPLRALLRLDHQLQRALDLAVQRYGSESLADPFRGLYVSADQLARAANGSSPVPGPDHGLAAGPSWDALCASLPIWDWLRTTFRFEPFDLDVVLTALAPEVERRYERAYAYLQDDVSCKQPRVGLALDLWCASAEERLARRRHFDADAPLIRERVVQLSLEPGQAAPSLLNHALTLDPQIVDALLGQGGLDRRLASFCRIDTPMSSPTDADLPAALLGARAAWRAARADGRPLRLYLYGPPGSATREAADAVAADLGLRVLEADITRLVATGADLDQLQAVLLRESRFHDALLYLTGLDVLRTDAVQARFDALFRQLASHPGLAVLAGSQPWPATVIPTRTIVVPLGAPSFEQRRRLWQAALTAHAQALPPAELDMLAARFKLTPPQIADAVAVQPREISRATLFEAARAQAGQPLAGLAHRIVPLHDWDDLVLPPDALRLLREIGQRVAHAERVLGTWGFGRKLSLGRGVSVLFAGPSGTGKTMAAEVIAGDLGLDLYRIDLSTIVSKYIGETERNLERVFTAAESANVILFFDEADAVFGRRSEVRDSHDRYANLEVAYLLQRMEQYDGLAILATNLRENLDEAFVRRLEFVVTFPFPDEAHRRRLWEIHLPPDAPRADDLDLAHLAARFRLSGGNIKNVTLAAAFLAAAEDRPIGMAHLLRAVQREHQKLGRIVPEADLVWP
jgi:hypothetical protein